MKKSDLKRRLFETQSELHEAIWNESKQKYKIAEALGELDDAKALIVAQANVLKEKEAENDEQLVMLANQVTTIMQYIKKVKKLKAKMVQ